jgi:prepilin-type N-terminal cleavage/methylation domain-containing protein
MTQRHPTRASTNGRAGTAARAPSKRWTGFTLVELMIVVGIIGIITSLAIPAFQKYVRRSRVMEGVRGVRAMFDGSVTYYADEHSDRAGNIVAKQFPVSTGPTPALGTCCTFPSGKCPGEPSIFEADATWTAVSFTIADPHFFSYTYASSGDDQTAQFSARANADLNCNSLYSTFERVGVIDSGEYVNGTALYKHLALE